MDLLNITGSGAGSVRPAEIESPSSLTEKRATEVKLQFEQMLWAEMLSHAGLEKAFTQGGGEAASAFSRYVVESISRDLAEKHPLGLADKVNTESGAVPSGAVSG